MVIPIDTIYLLYYQQRQMQQFFKHDSNCYIGSLTALLKSIEK